MIVSKFSAKSNSKKSESKQNGTFGADDFGDDDEFNLEEKSWEQGKDSLAVVGEILWLL